MTVAAPAAHPHLRRNAAFLRLFVASTVSELGTSVSELALPLVAIITLAAGPLATGALSTVEFLPYLVVTLPAGVWVDRMRRRRLMVAADLVRTVAMASVPLAWWLGALTLAQLYAVAFVVASLTIVFDLAYQAWLPDMLQREHLVAANSALQVGEQGSAVAGPGIAGLLVGRLGAPVALLVDSVSYAVSALILLGIPAHDDDLARPTAASPRDGLQHVLRIPTLRALALSSAVLSLTSRAAYVLLLLHLVRDERIGAATLGLLLSLGTVGFVAGAILAPRLVQRVGVGRALTGASAAIPVALLLLTATSGALAAPLTVAGFALYGGAAVVSTVGSLSVRQAAAPAELRGRVNAAMRLLTWGTLPLAGITGGALGAWLGLTPAMAACAAASTGAVVPLLLARVSRLRTLDDVARA